MKEPTYTHEQMLDAMSLWEALLDGVSDADREWYKRQCAEGACMLRDTFATMSPLCAMAYERAHNVYDFDDSYDWDWCPKWLEAVKAICIDTDSAPEIVALECIEQIARTIVRVEA